MVTALGSTAGAADRDAPDRGASARAENYTVQPGDTLAEIARAHGMSADALAALNGIDNPNLIRLGQKLRLRESTVPSSTGPAKEPPTGSAASDGGATRPGQVHVVEAGDTYSKIAKRYDVRVSWLVEANPGVDPGRLRVGQELRIALPTAPVAAEAETNPKSFGSEDGESKDGPVKVKVVRSEGDFVRSLANPDTRPELKRVKRVEDDPDAP